MHAVYHICMCAENIKRNVQWLQLLQYNYCTSYTVCKDGKAQLKYSGVTVTLLVTRPSKGDILQRAKYKTCGSFCLAKSRLLCVVIW